MTPVETVVEEKVVIKPIIDTSVGEEITESTSVEPAEPELESVENVETEGAEFDFESVPQVDYSRVPAQSE